MIKRLYFMWLRKKLDKKQYEVIVMDMVDKINEIVDFLEQHELDKNKTRQS